MGLLYNSQRQDLFRCMETCTQRERERYIDRKRERERDGGEIKKPTNKHIYNALKHNGRKGEEVLDHKGGKHNGSGSNVNHKTI